MTFITDPSSETHNYSHGRLTPEPFYGKRKCLLNRMASEHSILTDCAARLGIYRLNRYQPTTEDKPKNKRRSASVHREAELLLNFRATAPEPEITSADTLSFENLSNKMPTSSPKTPESRPSLISPSFSFEAKKCEKGGPGPNEISFLPKHHLSVTRSADKVKRHQPSITATKSNTFTIHCPSLSLKRDPVEELNAPTSPAPSFLFSRPISTKPINTYSNDLGSVAETLATNLVESFEAAMNWRTKTWIKALSRVLSIRYQVQKSELYKKAKLTKLTDVNLESIKEELKKSHESRVINALHKAASNVDVHDVRTTFFVLEQQIGAQDNQGDESEVSSPYQGASPILPRLKRRRQVTREEDVIETGKPYNLSHAITLDARCSVSTSPMKKMTVSFRTPGAIHGTFVRDSKGNAQLQSVRIALDADALSLVMDQNSRRVMRAATEECMVSPPVNYCTIYDTVQEQTMAAANVSSDDNNSDCTPEPQAELDSQCYYSDRRYDHYFSSPTADIGSPGNLVTPTVQDSCFDGPGDFKGPIPMRSLPLQAGKGKAASKNAFLNPRRVSPTEHQTLSGSFDSPTPTKVTFTNLSTKAKGLPTTDRQFLVPPSLVSPYSNKNRINSNLDVPTMPALLEVARKAHAKCH